MKRLLVLSILLLMSRSAGAISGQFTLQGICEETDVAVIADVTSRDSYWTNGNSGFIVTDVELLRVRTIHGSLPSSAFTLTVEGGRVGDILSIAADAPSMPEDSRYILFMTWGPNNTLRLPNPRAAIRVEPGATLPSNQSLATTWGNYCGS